MRIRGHALTVIETTATFMFPSKFTMDPHYLRGLGNTQDREHGTLRFSYIDSIEPSLPEVWFL